LLVVHVKSKNSANTVLDVDSSNGSFNLEVRRVPDGLRSGSQVDAEAGELVASRNLMPDDGWRFLPLAEFDNTTAIVVPAGGTFALSAELKRGEDYEAAEQIVHVPR